MVTPYTAFANNYVAAHAVAQHIAPHRFSLRPYNRFLPDFTEWWFFTSGRADSWPAYRFSKLFIQTFRPASEEGPRMYAGFYVEKGYDPVLAGMHGVKRTYIMHADWYWHQFLSLASQARYEQSIQETKRRADCPIWISIDIQGFNRPPELDAERPPFDDIVQFTVVSEGANLHLERPGGKMLKQLNTCEDLPALATRIASMEDLRFFWVNFQIGILLKYGQNDPRTWGAAELWHNALEPWDSWV